MERLKYFRDASVKMFTTRGVKNELPAELCQHIFTIAFQRAKELEAKGIETDCYLFITVKTEKYNGMFTRCNITIEQEQPEYETKHKVLILGDFKINTRLYLIESWNGKTVDVTPEDHYITLLFPREY
ncbi:MAG: hypothetical protein NC548_45030 [Lachnospiraceae bacterium]|nr:hypothetical protein [Lachnospiraceae bacterium]